MVFQDVGKLLGIACKFVGKKTELIPRLVIGVAKKETEEKIQMAAPEMENSCLANERSLSTTVCAQPSVPPLVIREQDMSVAMTLPSSWRGPGLKHMFS